MGAPRVPPLNPSETIVLSEGSIFRSRVKSLITIGSCGTLNCYLPNSIFNYFIGDPSRDSAYHFQIMYPDKVVDVVRKLISAMKSNVLQGARRSLEDALPVIQARIAHPHNRRFKCYHCGVISDSLGLGGRQLYIGSKSLRGKEPWPKCVHCAL